MEHVSIYVDSQKKTSVTWIVDILENTLMSENEAESKQEVLQSWKCCENVRLWLKVLSF